MSYFISALKKYAIFEGRARRAEYWFFQLFCIIVALILGLLEGLIGFAPNSEDSILAMIFQFLIVIPSLGVSIRRMHDVDRSGWFILVPIYNFILTMSEGDRGNNNYGADPKVKEYTKSGF